MAKKRVLFVGEASCLNTGFGTYYRELIPRLLETGKYEIGEIGCYVHTEDPKAIDFVKGRWRFWGTLPRSQEEAQMYNMHSPHPRDKGQLINQFGAHIFDQVVADFKPDIVIDIRDNWMLTWQQRSPFRPWFKLIWMPTVDAEPQAEEWIQDYEQADLVLAYSDYGVNALKRQSKKMKVFPKAMRPGVDLSTFHPKDKEDVRENFNLSKEVTIVGMNVVGHTPIIGTVMRNQSRKLFPDLLDAFALMKTKFAGEEAVDKALMLIHSCWPDNMFSYDYPRHIYRLHTYDWMEYHHKGIHHHVLQTYKCSACGAVHVGFAASLYNKPIEENGVKLACPVCGKNEARAPGPGNGFTREELADVYNLMDLYVQCTICEGDGMPIQEAKACGVPTLVTDYTAMREKGAFPHEYAHLKDLGFTADNYPCHKGGEIIDIGRFYMEPDTSCKRALPSVEDLAQKMRDIIVDDARRKQMSEDARESVEEAYDWDKLVKNWEFVLDKVSPKPRENTWDSVPHVRKAKVANMEDVPENLDNEKFVEWLYLNVLKYDAVDPGGAEMWVGHLNSGVSRDQLYQQFMNLAQASENSENARERIRAAVAKAKGEEYVSEEEQSQGAWI